MTDNHSQQAAVTTAAATSFPPTPCAGSAATVISVLPESVHLSVETAAACRECKKGRGCGLGLKAAGDGRVSFALTDLQLLSPQRELLPDSASEVLQPGANVLLLLPQPQLMKFVVNALFMPALVFILCVWVGHSLALLGDYPADSGALAGIVAGVCCGLILARKQSRKLERDTRTSHHVKLVVEDAD